MLVVYCRARAYTLEMATFAEASVAGETRCHDAEELTVPRSGKEFIFVTGVRRSGKSSYAPVSESLGKRGLYRHCPAP